MVLKAIRVHQYGAAEVLKYEEVPLPEPIHKSVVPPHL